MRQHYGLCAACGGRCCKQPLMTPQEFVRVFQVACPEDVSKQYRITSEALGWLRVDHPTCLALGPDGCRLNPKDRPIVCQIYPFQFMIIGENRYQILLDLSVCPHWKVWGEEYAEAVREFAEFIGGRVDDRIGFIPGGAPGSDVVAADH